MKRLALLDDPVSVGLLEALCQARNLDAGVAVALVAAVRGHAGRARRRGLTDQFDTLLLPRETISR